MHLILDNYAAHKHPRVRKRLARHERFTFPFTPTSCSWLNAVEGFFAKLTKQRLKRGVFRSVVDLQAAINRFLEERNRASKPFTWTTDPDKIIAAVRRGSQAPDSIHWVFASVHSFSPKASGRRRSPMLMVSQGASKRDMIMYLVPLGAGASFEARPVRQVNAFAPPYPLKERRN